MAEKKAVKKDPEFKSLAWCKAFANTDFLIAKRTQKFTAKEKEEFLKERLAEVKKMYGLR